ncbi:MAG: hypothetical protein Q8S54_10585 [Bacteroidota bacterium]|nr:hypothetical protein [Odoribacter sp.]MDP3643620.1 hypothetical protein [Bacteroidota bacterium]
MATVTVKINTRTRKTKYLMGLISEIAKNDKNVEIIGQGESPYTPEFVLEIQKSRASKGKIIKTEDIWK